jgi:hypothetical protein
MLHTRDGAVGLEPDDEQPANTSAAAHAARTGTLFRMFMFT